MSSSEQAPEPTMDEILASIRKIIADDDQGAQGAENQAVAAEPAPVAGGGQAETEQANLVDDIANALNPPASGAAAPVQAEEDIFDLTNEVAATPPQPAVDADAAPVAEIGQPDVLAQSEAAAPAVQMPVDAEMAPDSQPQPLPGNESILSGRSATDDVLAGTPMIDTPIPEDAAGFDVPATEAALESALGNMAAAAPEPEAVAAPEIEIPEITASEEAPVPATVEASLDTGSFAHEEMADPAGTGVLGVVEESVAGIALAAEVMVEDAVMPEAELPEPAPEHAAVAAEAESAEPASGGVDAKSLEDSVREMLKPMLREWLDENMPRIVQEAANDEKNSAEGGS